MSSPNRLNSLEFGLHTVRTGYDQIVSSPLPRRFCVEICGSASDKGPEADEATELAHEIVRLGGTVLVSGARSGPSLARRAAAEARTPGHLGRTGSRSRAIVIETSELSGQSSSGEFAVHLGCPSHGGRDWLANRFCGATVLFSGGLDIAARYFNLMIAKRTHALPERHGIILVGKQGHQLALLAHHAVENGLMNERELHWFEVAAGGKEALSRLQVLASEGGRNVSKSRRRKQSSSNQADAFITSYRDELQVLVRELGPYEQSIGVLGSGAHNLPNDVIALFDRQLMDYLRECPLVAVRHGGYDGFMRRAAQLAHKLSTSIAIRTKVEGRPQATCDDHSVLVVLDSIDLRQAGLLGPDNQHNLFWAGGFGTSQEMCHQSNSVRYLVDAGTGSYAGYWNPWLQFLNEMVDDGLMDEPERKKFRLVDHPLSAFAA